MDSLFAERNQGLAISNGIKIMSTKASSRKDNYTEREHSNSKGKYMLGFGLMERR